MANDFTPVLYLAVLEKPSHTPKYFPLFCFEEKLFKKTLTEMQEEGYKQLYRTELPAGEIIPNNQTPPIAFRVNQLIARANDIGKLNLKELEVLLNN